MSVHGTGTRAGQGFGRHRSECPPADRHAGTERTWPRRGRTQHANVVVHLSGGVRVEADEGGISVVLLTDVLRKMAKTGQSVTLCWGEGTELWECSWISGGQRYSGFSTDPVKAVLQVLEQAGVQVP